MNAKDDFRFYPAADAVIPRHFPKVYESSRGEIIVYLGAILNGEREMGIGCSPYWAEGKHSTDEDIRERIRGFYRLQSGIIYEDKFLDEDTFFPFEVAEKDEYVDLPVSASSYYGICACKTQEENTKDTRKVFGLTYEELSEILGGYGRVFGLGNAYRSYPRITRSTQRSNCCDLTHAWIPRNFPYIAFDNSDFPFSHVSIGGFYDHLRLLLLHGNRSVIWKVMVEQGVKEVVLEHIISMREPWQPPVRYGEFTRFL